MKITTTASPLVSRISTSSRSTWAGTRRADILAGLTGAERYTARYRNTCWSLLAANDSIKIGASYKPGEKDGKAFLEPSGGFVSKPSESAQVRVQNYTEGLAWYHAISLDAFNDDVPVGQKG